MAHILKHKIWDNVVFLIVEEKPSRRELKIKEFEYIGTLDIPTGQYTPAQVRELLEDRYIRTIANSYKLKS